jgi:hypothetical protein
MRKTLLILALILALSGCSPAEEVVVDPADFIVPEATQDVLVEVSDPVEVVVPEEEPDLPAQAGPEPELVPEPIVAEVNLPVPFQMQAPYSNWDMPYQEMCEEAALVLAYKYFANEPLDKDIMDAELTKAREWEIANFGLFTDTTLEEMKQLAEEHFGLEVTISEEVSTELIKDQLRQGYLVLVPTAGRELGNPFYKQPGPLYHVLVIRGFNETEFITNDVGIGKGEEYKFKYQTVLQANHDLPISGGKIFRPYDEDLSEEIKESEMLVGEKRIMIVKGLK